MILTQSHSGTDTISAIYALGFAVRSALTFGGMKGGQARAGNILLYNREPVSHLSLRLVKWTI